jgi:aspartyl/asparaginyl-tRNA synthetase
LDNNKDDLAFFNDRIKKGLIEYLEGLVVTDWKRVDYTEAIEVL